MKIILPIILTIIYHLSGIDAEIPHFKRRGGERGGLIPHLQNPPRHGPPASIFKKWSKSSSPSHHYQKMVPPHSNNPNRFKGNQQPLKKHQQQQRIGLSSQRIGIRAPQASTKIPYQFNYHQNKIVQQPPHVTLHKNVKSPAVPPYNSNKKTTIKFPQNAQQAKKFIQKQEILLPQQKQQQVLPPPAVVAEHDIHIQTNSIPITAIKQTGEFGPIHTIPAPKLGPADKSNHFELKKKELRQHQQELEYHKSQYLSQNNAPPKPVQNYYHHQQLHPQSDYQVTEQNELGSSRPYATIPHTESTYLQTILSNDQRDASSYQHVHTSIPYSQNKLEESYQDVPVKYYQPNQPKTQTQAILSSFIQQKPQPLPHQIPYRDGNDEQLSYVIQQVQTNDDDNGDEEESDNDEDKRMNPPELHSFNYDEQAHQAQVNSAGNNFVSATYSLGPGIDTIQRKNDVILDPLTQSQIIQNYFDPRIKEEIELQNNENGKEMSNIATDLLIDPSFYESSLPNKEAAERLAQLQIAGRVNSNLMQLASNRKMNQINDSGNTDDKGNQTTNEDDEVKKEIENQNQSKATLNDYDEYSEEEPVESSEENEAEKIED